MNSHSKLKEDAQEEWKEMNDLDGILPHQLEIIKSAYDYGWYNAYGLESDDTRHKELMAMLKETTDKIVKLAH